MSKRILLGNLLKQAILVILVASCFTTAAASLSFWFGDIEKNIERMNSGTYNPYREFNQWINSFFFSKDFINYFMNNCGDEFGYYLVCYFRDYIAGTIVYWMTAGIWHWVLYGVLGKLLFDNKKREYPSKFVISEQMIIAQASLTVYAALPILSEYLIESGYTKAYFYIEEVGWYKYSAYFLAYLTLVEIGIYWMHRTLHTNKTLYNYIHLPHHKYNNHASLTPWASIAFHPLDGILQASPYVAFLFVVPMHYFTHVIMLFFTGIWATNIHDAIYADSEPIMGAKYHTLHHTHYTVNYGQFFIFCDWFWGTLKVPDANDFDKKASKATSEPADFFTYALFGDKVKSS